MPETKTVQSVDIQSFTIQPTSTSLHAVYHILVRLAVQSWKVERRYSDFDALSRALSKETRQPSPQSLPPKKPSWNPLAARDTQKMQQHALAEQRLPVLRSWLKAILEHSDPSWRESHAFREFLKVPDDCKFVAPKMLPSKPPSDPKPAGRQWEASSSNSRGDLSAFRRAGAGTIEPKETEQTRALDEGGLLSSQQQQLSAQDEQLGRLASILRRQREMGTAINHELAEQTELLQQLDTEVDGVQSKMSKGGELMKTLEES